MYEFREQKLRPYPKTISSAILPPMPTSSRAWKQIDNALFS